MVNYVRGSPPAEIPSHLQRTVAICKMELLWTEGIAMPPFLRRSLLCLGIIKGDLCLITSFQFVREVWLMFQNVSRTVTNVSACFLISKSLYIVSPTLSRKIFPYLQHYLWLIIGSCPIMSYMAFTFASTEAETGLPLGFSLQHGNGQF